MSQLADVGCIGRKKQTILTAGYHGFLGGIWEGYLRCTCEKGDVSEMSSSARLLTVLMRVMILTEPREQRDYRHCSVQG